MGEHSRDEEQNMDPGTDSGDMRGTGTAERGQEQMGRHREGRGQTQSRDEEQTRHRS